MSAYNFNNGKFLVVFLIIFTFTSKIYSIEIPENFKSQWEINQPGLGHRFTINLCKSTNIYIIDRSMGNKAKRIPIEIVKIEILRNATELVAKRKGKVWKWYLTENNKKILYSDGGDPVIPERIPCNQPDNLERPPDFSQKCDVYLKVIDKDPNGLNVRSKPVNGKIITTLLYGTKIYVSDSKNGWFRLVTPKKAFNGWVYRKFTEDYFGHNLMNWPLTSLPESKGKSLHRIKENYSVSLLDCYKNSLFVRITYPNKKVRTGWVHYSIGNLDRH